MLDGIIQRGTIQVMILSSRVDEEGFNQTISESFTVVGKVEPSGHAGWWATPRSSLAHIELRVGSDVVATSSFDRTEKK